MITFSVAKRRVRLSNCQPGLFFFDGEVCCKSEYKTESAHHVWQSDAYVTSSGEYFWGGAKSAEQRERLLVRPMMLIDLGNDAP